MAILQPTEANTAFEKPPHIRKGYYVGQLTEAKQRVDTEGNAHIGKFGKQMILFFAIHKIDESNGKETIGQQVTYEPQSNIVKDVIIPAFVYTEYKNQDGSYQSAIKPGTKPTATFEALGWKFDAKSVLDTDTLIGNWAEINIDDYEAEYTRRDGSKEKQIRSVIKEVKPFKGTIPAASNKMSTHHTGVKIEKELKHEQINVKEEIIGDDWMSKMTEDEKANYQSILAVQKQGVISQIAVDEFLKNVKERVFRGK